jgi:DNA polymerase
MVNAEKRDYPIVLHIHDELVSDKEKGQGSLDEFKQIVCDLPEWADGLPIDAEGEESERFKK